MIQKITLSAQRKEPSTKSTKRSALCALLFAFMFYALCFSCDSFAEGNPLEKMRDETISYFKPLTGRITAVGDKKVTVNIGAKDSVRKGMRFQILREEAPFKHPVTKEPLGKLESLVGKFEIKEVGADSSTGEILEGSAKEGDKIRISAIGVSLLFCQSRDTDWRLADSYYRMLKESGRFNMIDTDIDTDAPSKALEEAKRLRAEVALLLSVKKTDSGTVLTQKLLWVSDGVQFLDAAANIDAVFTKEVDGGDAFFKPSKEEAWLQFDLPFDARRIAACDIDGDGKKEIVLATGKDIGVYTVGADIQPAHGGIKIAGSTIDNPLWIDCIDLNGNGREEIVVTTMASGAAVTEPDQPGPKQGDNTVISYIYEFNGSEFAVLYKYKGFLRRMGNGLIAQEYSSGEGFSGEVFNIIWDKGCRKGNSLKLPKGVNIYDFVYIEDPRLGRLLLAYDEGGFLNLYNDKDTRIWRSKTYAGGFLNSFTKKAPSGLIDKGEWSIKDRLFLKNNKVLSVKRIPFVEMIKGLGFKRSQIKDNWWNGLSMDEGILIGDIRGTLYDYAVDGDKIIVLTSPLFGIKAGNILKGENPLKSELFIYKMKGM